MRKFTLLIVLLSSLLGSALAQTGTWNPPGADLSRPRTLLRSNEFADARTRLTDPVLFSLYQGLYTQAISYGCGVPGSDGARRNNAHIAKNIGLILCLDRKAQGGIVDTLSSAERATLSTKAICLLENMNTTVEGYPTFESYLWRSNELIDHLIAYDMLLGAGVSANDLATSRSKLVEYTANLYEECEIYLFGYGFWAVKLNNHALRVAGALGMAGVVLNDQGDNSDANRRAENWINAGIVNIENVLWHDNLRQCESGVITAYAEGPHYLAFGFKHVLPFFQAMGNFLPDSTLSYSHKSHTFNIRNPFFDSRYDMLWEWIMRIRKPDGKMPPLEDSFVHQSLPLLALTEKPQYLWEGHYGSFGGAWGSQGLRRQLTFSSDDIRADYIAVGISPAPGNGDLFQYLPEAGNAVFRSSWDSNAVYFLLNGQHGKPRESGMGHNQADGSSFVLYAYGQELLMDPGYVKWDRRDEVDDGEQHNVILIDNGAPDGAGTLNPQGMDAWLEAPLDMEQFDRVQARTNYNNNDITRKFFFLRNRYVVGEEHVQGQHNQCSWQAHGHGWSGTDTTGGIYTADYGQGRGIYRHQGVSAAVYADGVLGPVSWSDMDNVHEYDYDSVKKHSTYLATSTHGGEEIFISAMIPFVSDSPMVDRVEDLSGDFAGFHTTWTDGEDLFVRNPDGAKRVYPANLSGMSDDFTSQGLLSLFSLDPSGAYNLLYTEQTDSLEYGPNQLFAADQTLDFIVEQRPGDKWRGYISDAGTVRLWFPDFTPQSVNGWGISSWNYDAGTEMLEMQFSKSAWFWINKDFVVGGMEPAPASQLKVYPNPGRNVLHLEWEGHPEAELSVMNLSGQEILRKKNMRGQGSLNTQDWPAGLYFIVLEENENRVIRKWVKQ